ncbi:MAG: hypothetical protein ABSB80_05525 [Methanoregula sp.]|jgi:hypothetical protein|uniref:hypothetical protein n=1 Tax=Methanoregula sp. TaxID=2052170 RepID=UPI003D11C10D
MELTEILKTFIEEGQDWERKQTSVKGVSIIRLPATKNRAASLAIDINPIGDNGLPMKKKGIMIMNRAEIAAFRTAFNNEKVDGLVAALEEVLPERKTSGKPAKADVLQI